MDLCESWMRAAVAVVTTAALLSVAGASAAHVGTCEASEEEGPINRPWSIGARRATTAPRLESVLYDLQQVYSERDEAATLEFAESRGLEVDGLSALVTVFPPLGGDSRAVSASRLEELRCEILAQSTHLLDLSVPIENLAALATSSGVGQVRPIVRQVELDRPEGRPVTSEAVELIGADTPHDNGYYGGGVTVAVIDGGFENMTNAAANGDLPPVFYYADFVGTGMEEGGHHGTAVTEDVYDIAPGATYHLIRTSTLTHVENAKDYCVANGVDIVNFSAGYHGVSGLNGGGLVCGIVEDAYSNGILWCNSAGNHALDHNEGTFTDTNVNGFHEFAPGDEFLTFVVPPLVTFMIYLTWDGWPLTTEDYDLFLLNSGGYQVASSVNTQFPGGYPPSESITYSTIAGGTYHVVIANYYTTSNHSYDLVFPNLNLSVNGEYNVTSGSLITPSDAPHALAVAAMHKDHWLSGPCEEFSSRGPTNDGRIKPEITGPDGCASFTDPGWVGTSSASPYVVGAAALVRSILTELDTPDELANWLIASAVDMGAPGQDNTYGYGRVNIPPDTPVEESFYAALSEDGTVVLRWLLPTTGYAVGYHVYRSESPGGDFVRITADLLPLSETGLYIDRDVWPGGSFCYELRELIADGSEAPTIDERPCITVEGTLSLGLEIVGGNPSSQEFSIRYSIPAQGRGGRLCIYNVAGRLVETLHETLQAPCSGVAKWSVASGSGERVPSGVYFARLETDRGTRVAKLVVVR